MKRRYALNIFMGMVIGAVFFGTALSPTIRNAYLEIVLGAAGGMFISWFIAAAVRENEILNQVDDTPNNVQEIETSNAQQQMRSAHGDPIFNQR